MPPSTCSLHEPPAGRKPAFGRRDPKPWSVTVARRVQACSNHLLGRTWMAYRAGSVWVASTSTRDGRWRRCRPFARPRQLPSSSALRDSSALFSAACTHSVWVRPTKEFVHCFITASRRCTSSLSGACAWREACEASLGHPLTQMSKVE